jgi:CheY-like chemotaxis protein/predicted regulator of Ras-like GTPase activity (Roadblock/LC7/MglB family)
MAKVLVVDDSLSVRKVVERALVGRRIEVVCAATGTEALERIERDQPDVVVCDVVMPDRDGYEICQFIKGHPRLSRTPVLLMSGIVNDEVRERAARVQSADVLSKPFAADDLLRKLETLIASNPREVAPPAPPESAHTTPANGNGHLHANTPLVPAAALASVPSVATSAPPPSLTEPAPTRSAVVLRQFAAIEGVQWAVLADREGFLLDASAEGAVNTEVAGALSACLAESSAGLGRELGRGSLHGMILEYEQGIVVLYSVGASALLAIALREPAVLGKVRYFAKKAVPELVQTI